MGVTLRNYARGWILLHLRFKGHEGLVPLKPSPFEIPPGQSKDETFRRHPDIILFVAKNQIDPAVISKLQGLKIARLSQPVGDRRCAGNWHTPESVLALGYIYSNGVPDSGIAPVSVLSVGTRLRD